MEMEWKTMGGWIPWRPTPATTPLHSSLLLLARPACYYIRIRIHTIIRDPRTTTTATRNLPSPSVRRSVGLLFSSLLFSWLCVQVYVLCLLALLYLYCTVYIVLISFINMFVVVLCSCHCRLGTTPSHCMQLLRRRRLHVFMFCVLIDLASRILVYE